MTDISQKQGGWTPGPWKACGTIYEHMNAEIRSGRKGEGQGIAQVWDGPNAFRDAMLMAAAPELYAALERAHQFITNGIELGFIRMPDPDCPDPALETPDIIRAALSRANPSTDQGGE